jgi:glyoxylase-like metal-dependent hydrolase (beta-lactamase superfamily II)
MQLEFPDSVSTFGDGDRLDLPGGPVVVHTPGHTEGHVMFHVPDRGLLFAGDGPATMDLLGFGTGPQMLDSRFHLDADQADTSLDRLVDLEADLLRLGHGQPWHGTPAAAVEAIRSR